MHLIPTFELPKDATRVWDLDVPIVVTENEVHAYLTDEIMEPYAYNELCYLLNTASKHQTFHLHINTPGGLISSTLQLVAAMQKSEATIIGHLSGSVASAGTMITMACDDIEVTPHISFMIHNYSSGLHGKGGELKARQAHDELILKNLFEDFYAGFLSPAEIKSVIHDKDMWMTTEEVQTRWTKRKAHIANPTTAIDTTSKPKRGRPKKGA